MKLTKLFVDKVQAPTNKEQVFYRDTQDIGFALRVTKSGIKSFIVEKLVQGKVRRITLGRFGALTVEQARKEAKKLVGKIAIGINPIAEKQLFKLKGLKLKDVLDDYIKTRKSLKASTHAAYKNTLNTVLSDFKNKPLLSITKDVVARHHAMLGTNNGKAHANYAMRVLRLLFNFAMGQYEDEEGRSLIVENPVKRLSQTRAWYRIERRRNYIKAYQLYAWHHSVMALENEVIRDYLIYDLFTGWRKNEAAQLKKENVDLKDKTARIVDPKNHETILLPLPDGLCELLKRRIETSPNEYVFPGNGKNGYLIEPRKQMAKITQATGIAFTIHDLRRTFATIAESLDIPAYALKRLLNHKIDKNDVTAGYIITDVERLRKPMQQIYDFILAKTLEEPSKTDINSTL